MIRVAACSGVDLCWVESLVMFYSSIKPGYELGTISTQMTTSVVKLELYVIVILCHIKVWRKAAQWDL